MWLTWEWLVIYSETTYLPPPPPIWVSLGRNWEQIVGMGLRGLSTFAQLYQNSCKCVKSVREKAKVLFWNSGPPLVQRGGGEVSWVGANTAAKDPLWCKPKKAVKTYSLELELPSLVNHMQRETPWQDFSRSEVNTSFGKFELLTDPSSLPIHNSLPQQAL